MLILLEEATKKPPSWTEEDFNLNFSVLQTKGKGKKEMTCASVLFKAEVQVRLKKLFSF